MVNRRKQWTRSLLLAIIACLCFSCTSHVSAASANDVVDSLYANISDNPGQVITLIRDYCSAVLGSSAFTNKNFVYNAQQSAFVYLLCSNVDTAGSSKLLPKYFLRSSFKDLGFTDITSDGGDLCAPATMDNDCNLSKNIPNLFNGIMNDYVNIKQSNLYGLIADYTDDNGLETQVNTYSQAYFRVDVCNNNLHPYDATCRMMKSSIKAAKNILSDVQIFDVGKITPTTSDVPCSSSDTTLNLLYCGLKDTGASMVSFVNLAYNELFYYRLFEGYYMIMLQQHHDILQRNTYNTNYSSILKKFSSQYIRSKTALSLSLRMMRDIYMAFPFHVGFSMYQEDLDGFGKNLALIAPPIYTLYDKLRNVQKPE